MQSPGRVKLGMRASLLTFTLYFHLCTSFCFFLSMFLACRGILVAIE